MTHDPLDSKPAKQPNARKPKSQPYKPVETIEVCIWDQQVGAIALDPRLGYYAFEYSPKFVRQNIELAPLTLPIQQREPFVFTNLPEATFKRLPALFADALPDDFGNALIDAWWAGRGVPAHSVTALDRLAYMGKRGLGALEFRPARGANRESSTAIQLSKLVESARLAVHGEFDNDAHTEAALAQIIQVGTSAGGARAKASIAWNPHTKEVRAGQFAVEAGFEHWLLKFDGLGRDTELGSSQDYGRIEYAYHLMARQAGITMSDCQLLEENGRAHFMTRRFDRDNNRKHHLQTLCGMDHLDYKQLSTHDYNQYFQVIQRLELGYLALEEAFRRMAFNVMTANCDDHTKNFSFILRQNEPWALAPAYDITFAYNPKGEWTYQHLMSVNGKFQSINQADLLWVADRFGIGTAEQVLATVREAVSVWPEFAEKAHLPNAEIAHIASSHTLL
jgi:serine/threonine-protein kinase HipA